MEFSSLLFQLKSKFFLRLFFFTFFFGGGDFSAFVFDLFDCFSYSSLPAIAIPEYM